ncbi:tetratricopeptide repeat protein [Clostridium sp. ZS2-4]|uniref:tetratricopeptide repeat protein n=1 Tax=Clostridium sp. ZS2-4 TaxID=2987703 RepID=UPI00227B916E|nr:hypothetical protein [Clostridium sp. ZS2-4]MCY6354678.1 hypothetical protein [Clostridium sp. ZS2-4]
MEKKYSSISLKSKLIIFVVVAIVSIGIVIMDGRNNRKNNLIIENKTNSKITSTELNFIQNKEILNTTDTSKSDETNRKINNKLEEKYKKGYDAFHSKKYEEAIKIENEVIAEDKNFYKAYSIKGIALCFDGNYEEGMKAIDKALEINSGYGYGRFNKALAYELYRYYDEALIWYDKALEVENYIWSYYGKASIYGRRGDIENTVKYLKIAIDMDASVKNLAKEERDFNNVRESKEFKESIQ